jgi:predicted RNA methylase
MKTTSSTATLKSQVEALLNLPIENHEEVNEQINQICYIYSDAAGIDGRGETPEFFTNVPTEVGISLSLNHAAACMTDYRRTHKLLKGAVDAIRDVLKEKSGEPVRFFYAGCGPLAPFMTMIAPLFSSEEIKFTLLEINKKSMEVAKELIKTLELTDYVEDYYTADAINFDLPNGDKFDILFSETLDSLLNREGYVPILWNLLPQLPADITVIPSNVQIKVNYKTEAGEETPFGMAFDTREMLAKTPKTDLLPRNLETVSFSLKDAENYKSLVIDTEVSIYKDYVLTRGESSISLAIEVPIKKPVEHEFVDFVYTIKPTPGLQIGVR